MHRTSFRKNESKRMLCPKCKEYLFIASYNPQTKTSIFKDSVPKYCKNCNTSWLVSVPSGVIRDGKEGVEIMFLDVNTDEQYPFFTATSRIINGELDKDCGCDKLSLVMQEQEENFVEKEVDVE